jgi:uncharacterized membrane protein YkoI
MKQIIAALILSLAFPALGSAATSAPLKGAQFLPQTKVTLEEARAKALSTEHGTIVDQELEKETGGSGLRYSFDIKAGKVTHEVGIDAVTGKVLEDTIDTGND